MEEETHIKLSIDLSHGSIQVEGDEKYAAKYLAEFKTMLSSKPEIHTLKSTIEPSVELSDEDKNQLNEVKPLVNRAKQLPPKIVPEEFDIDGDGSSIPALSAFVSQKSPGSVGKLILTIAYYITHYLGANEFSLGNIEFALIALDKKRPGFPNVIIGNNMRDFKWYQKGSDSQHWNTTRLGELFVTQKLPEEKSK